MNPAQFDKRITLKKQKAGDGLLCEEQNEHIEICKLWAMIKTLRGEEVMNGDTKMKNTSRFVVRYSKFLDELFNSKEVTLLEIHFKNKIYDIKSVINDDEQNKTFTIVAEGRL